MLKLIDGIDKEAVKDFGFKVAYSGTISRKTIGALDIDINWRTREISGCGFYPVGDRIVLSNINDMVEMGLIIQN